jgi:hypothetical protein
MEYAKIMASSKAIIRIMMPSETGLIAINIVNAREEISIIIEVSIIL